MSSNETIMKKRGVLLSTVLIMNYIVSPIGAGIYFFMPDAVLDTNDNLTEMAVMLLGVLTLSILGAAIFIWHWKKPAVIVLGVLIAAAYVINRVYEIPNAELGLISLVVYGAALRRKWGYFSSDPSAVSAWSEREKKQSEKTFFNHDEMLFNGEDFVRLEDGKYHKIEEDDSGVV